MDIAGAKALKKRLGKNGAEEAPSAPADVAEDAPPVFHWLGVSQPATGTPAAEVEDDAAPHSASLFSRLGLSLR